MADLEVACPTRACTMCGEVKPHNQDFFYRTGGGRPGMMARCKICIRGLSSASWAKDHDANLEKSRKRGFVYRLRPTTKERIRAAERARKAADPEGWRKSQKERDARHYRRHTAKVKAQCLARAKRDRQEKPEHVRARRTTWLKARLDGDPEFRIRYRLRQNMQAAIKRSLMGRSRGGTVKQRCGWTVSQLRSHLQRQFYGGMAWANYGTAWHIDHIQPVSSFHIQGPTCPEFRACWALTNLRPLLAEENLSKGARRTLLL